MATIRKRGELQWQAIVKRKGHPLTSRTFETRRDAEAWARGVESEIDRGIFVSRAEAENTTLREAIERYLVEVTPTKKGASQERYRMCVLLASSLAPMSLAAIRSVDVAKWRDRRLKIVKPGTVRLDLAALSSVFKTARLEWSIPVQNPVRDVKRPKPGRPRDRRFLDGEESSLLSAIAQSQNPWIAPMVQLAIETAGRRGELLNLRWDDVDLQRRVAKLRDTKNGETRDVPLSSHAVAVLRALSRSVSGRVFPVKPATATATWRRICARAGIKDLHLHDLRHEGTSRLFELHGLEVMEAAAVTGHKTLAMLKRYTHLRAEDLARKMK